MHSSWVTIANLRWITVITSELKAGYLGVTVSGKKMPHRCKRSMSGDSGHYKSLSPATGGRRFKIDKWSQHISFLVSFSSRKFNVMSELTSFTFWWADSGFSPHSSNEIYWPVAVNDVSHSTDRESAGPRGFYWSLCFHKRRPKTCLTCCHAKLTKARSRQS